MGRPDGSAVRLTLQEGQLLNRLRLTCVEGINLRCLWILARQQKETFDAQAAAVVDALAGKRVGVFARMEANGEITVFYLPVVVAMQLAGHARQHRGEVISAAGHVRSLGLHGRGVSAHETLVIISELFPQEFVCDFERGTVNFPNARQRSHLVLSERGAMSLQDAMARFGDDLFEMLQSDNVHILPVDGVHRVVVYSEELRERNAAFAREVAELTAARKRRIITETDALNSARKRIATVEAIERQCVNRVRKRRRRSKASAQLLNASLRNQKMRAVYLVNAGTYASAEPP